MKKYIFTCIATAEFLFSWGGKNDLPKNPIDNLPDLPFKALDIKDQH